MEAIPNQPDKHLGLSVCRLFCGAQIGTLWPYPTGNVTVKNSLVRFGSQSITLDGSKTFDPEIRVFRELVENKVPGHQSTTGSSVLVKFIVTDPESPFTLDMDTSYQLRVTKATDEDTVKVEITAENAFGARYALMTLSQLVVYDEFRNELLVSIVNARGDE